MRGKEGDDEMDNEDDEEEDRCGRGRTDVHGKVVDHFFVFLSSSIDAHGERGASATDM